MIGLVLAGLMAGAVLIQLAISRPWLGVTFAADETGAIHAAPAPGLDRSLTGPAQVSALRGTDGNRVAIEAGDLIEEPDALATYADMRRFFARQSALAGMMRGQSISIELLDGDTLRQMVVSPARMRPIGDLPVAFWVQMLVGLSSFLIGGWVWALRRDDLPARLFAMASLGIRGFRISCRGLQHP